MNASCHVHKWVTPRTASCSAYKWVMLHIRMGHVTHICYVYNTGTTKVMWHTHITHTTKAQQWHIMLHIQHRHNKGHVTHTCYIYIKGTTKACYIYNKGTTKVMLHTHVTHTSKARCTYSKGTSIAHHATKVMLHIHITHTTKAHCTCKKSISHTRMRHVTHMKGSCHAYEWMQPTLIGNYNGRQRFWSTGQSEGQISRQIIFRSLTMRQMLHWWRFWGVWTNCSCHNIGMAHSYVTGLIPMGHDSFMWGMTRPYGTWLIHTWHDSSICDMTHSCGTWLIHMGHDSFICDMTHWVVKCDNMWHDSFICDMTHSYFFLFLIQLFHVTWLIHMWHDSFICVTWLIHICDMTRSYVTWLIHMWHDSFICDMTHSYDMSLMNESRHS